MKIDNLGRPVFAAEPARAFNALEGHRRLLAKYVINRTKAEEIEDVIRYALATRERRLDVGFMVLLMLADMPDAESEPATLLARSMPLAVSDEMKFGALEGYIDSLRLLVIERKR
ncbi:hypothetical protein [Paraburkholderia sp. Cpub6]|uniref:hypothetical protein n=1 Tax=Paraburkholderia sp. Cpub6 TaxID=2723094 RepID=UPI00161C2D60|nr:hypothetical protein [Paraburkholderia sp. Cpub6]MBB5456899.1 hypothetical protein [Paraburkholderia sp. Cpub6]